MHGADHRARQRAIGGRPELEQREAEGDPEGDPAGQAIAEAGRQALDCFFRGMWTVLALQGCYVGQSYLLVVCPSPWPSSRRQGEGTGLKRRMRVMEILSHKTFSPQAGRRWRQPDK